MIYYPTDLHLENSSVTENKMGVGEITIFLCSFARFSQSFVLRNKEILFVADIEISNHQWGVSL